MRFGFSSLYLIALGLYELAWLTTQPGALFQQQFETANSEAGAEAITATPQSINRV